MKGSYNILAITMLLGSCQSIKKPDVPVLSSDYSLEHIAEIELIQFKVETPLMPLLDSIVDLVVSCDKYKNLPVGFSFNSFSNVSNERHVQVGIVLEPLRLDYENSKGIFYYKGYQFAYFGDILEDSFTTLGARVKILYLYPKIRDETISKYDATFESYWDYILQDGAFKCVQFHYCDTSWYDSLFYKGTN